MPNTYTLIEKIVVGAAGASTITFTSIPQTYTDLAVHISARNTSSFNAEAALLSLNSSTSSFSGIYLQGNGSATSSGSYTRFGFNMPAANSTASTFSNSFVYFPNYTSSNNKSYTFDSVTENNGTEAYQTMFAGLWSNTAAITSITFTANSGNFAQYSTFYLYGIAKEGVTPSPSSAPYATGGDKILFDGTYWYHAFTSSGTFTPTKSLTADIIVIGGGGGGGAGYPVAASGSGGGGAGGRFQYSSSVNVSSATTVTIGGGGASATDGSTTSFGATSSSGGAKGTSGGPGLGGTAYDSNSGSGGNGGYGSGTPPVAGGNGTNAYASILNATESGVSGRAAGGGGGGGWDLSGAAGGGGGGGAGGNSSPGGAGTAGSAGTTNTGSGGGGGGAGSSGTPTGGSGGSGIVIVRYAA